MVLKIATDRQRKSNIKMVNFKNFASKIATILIEKCEVIRDKVRCENHSLEKKFCHRPQLNESIIGVEEKRGKNVSPAEEAGISQVHGSGISQVHGSGISQAQGGGVIYPESEDNVNTLSDSDRKEFTENITDLRKKKCQFSGETDLKLRNIEDEFDKYLTNVWSKYVDKQRQSDVVPGGVQVELPAEPVLLPVGVPIQQPADQPVQCPGGGRGGGSGGQFDLLLSQIPDLSLRNTSAARADPGGGKGGGGGEGAGGQQPHPPDGGPPPKDLLIKVSPQKWGCEAAVHTQESCQASWYATFNELYKIITEGSTITPGFSFVWEEERARDPNRAWTEAKINQQFLGMFLVHVATRDLPGSSKQNSHIDFFNWRDHNDFLGTSLDYSIKNCLSGVNLDDPTQRFTPGDQEPDEATLPAEVNLRSGLVIAFRMLEDLATRNYRVRVEYKFGNPEADHPTVKVIEPGLVKMVHEALGDVSLVLHNVFIVQKIADNLGVMLEEITEEKIGELEELHCDFVVGDASVDEVRATAQKAMKTTNQVKKMYKHYEATIVKISDENIITQAQAQRTFNDIDLLIRFLRNHASQELPWIRSPARYTTVKTQATFSGVPVKITENPSRLMVPIAVTAVNAHIAKIKDLVQRLLEGVSERTPSSRSVSKEASVERDFVSEKKKPIYPARLLRDAKEFHRTLALEEVDEETPVYLLEDWMTKTTVYVEQVQEFQWQHEISLSTEHASLLEELKETKTNLAGIIKGRSESKRKKEVEERELARSLQVSKPVELLANGANISNWLFYHDQFKACSKMSRVLKIKETLPKELLPRVQNELCPDSILKLFKSIFLSEDYLIPLSRREIEKQRNFPKPNSPEEKKSFVAIWGLIQRLTQAGLERKLDFTMIGLSLSKLSRVRQDNFEEKWVEKQVELEEEPVEVLEREKQKLFISFIKIQENLLVRRQLQSSILKEDELSKREKAFTVRTTKHEKRFAKPGEGGAASGGEDYRCPVCSQKGGHPRTTGSRVGCSARTLSRCQKFRQKPQGEKLPLIKRLGCERCMSVGSHGIQECQLPADTSWLKHDSCASPPGHHHPSVCPTRPWPVPTSSSSQQ